MSAVPPSATKAGAPTTTASRARTAPGRRACVGRVRHHAERAMTSTRGECRGRKSRRPAVRGPIDQAQRDRREPEGTASSNRPDGNAVDQDACPPRCSVWTKSTPAIDRKAATVQPTGGGEDARGRLRGPRSAHLRASTTRAAAPRAAAIAPPSMPTISAEMLNDQRAFQRCRCGSARRRTMSASGSTTMSARTSDTARSSSECRSARRSRTVEGLPRGHFVPGWARAILVNQRVWRWSNMSAGHHRATDLRVDASASERHSSSSLA